MNREETEHELELYSLRIARKTNELYNEVKATLNTLILSETAKRKAIKALDKAYESALATTDFNRYFTEQTIDVIADVSYEQAVLNIAVKSHAEYARKLPRISLFDDDITLSKRIRTNYDEIVKGHKKILDEALEAGQGIVKTSRQINNAGGFDPELPKYIRDLERSKIAGKRLNKADLARAKRQIAKIKTPGLKQNYTRLVNAIDLGKNVDKAVENALVSKSKSFADRLAKTESINTQANVKIARHAQDKNVKYIKSVTSGSNPCNFCKAMEGLGWIPFESAPKFVFHPFDTCTLHVRRTTKDVPKLTNKQFNGMFETELKRHGVTYVNTTPLRNLRENTIVDKLKKV
jgi:hypothetical protein